MPRFDRAAPRLFLPGPLDAGVRAPLDRDKAHYLMTVLRLADGDEVLAFDGASGEWRARLEQAGRREAALVMMARTRPQPPRGAITLMFAPLKAARLDYVIQKAVEMGAARIVPVITERTQVARFNGERAAANLIEAAEQCGIIALPALDPPARLAEALAALPASTLLVMADENADDAPVLEALSSAGRGREAAVLVGPEGGFSPAERAMLLARPSVLPVPLGPRILRADTAAVAIMALVQATLGDW